MSINLITNYFNIKNYNYNNDMDYLKIKQKENSIPTKKIIYNDYLNKNCKEKTINEPINNKLNVLENSELDINNYTKEDIFEYNVELYKKNQLVLEKYIKSSENSYKLNKVFKNDKIIKLIKIWNREIKDKKNYFKRIYKEFRLIIKFRFEEVFFQVHEILKLSNNYPHIIRGSAGSCLLCYLMKITHIDPIEENIELSRFMHKKRKDIPDIDIDFPSTYRDLIYKKIFAKWKDKVARISNHIKFKEKSAIREAIRDEGYRKFVPKDIDLHKIFKDEKIVKKVELNAKKKK